MTTYPVNLPSLNIASMVMTLERVVGASESPYTYQMQTFNWGGERWRLDFTPPPLTREQADEWTAFSLSLDGMVGTFLAGDPSYVSPRGVGGGTPLVKGAGQTGKTLLIDGCPTSTTGWLRKGDYFQLGTGTSARLHKLIDDATTNGSGETTLEFRPALRTSPADNAAVVISSPKGLFRMDGNVTTWGANNDKTWSFSFSAMEAL